MRNFKDESFILQYLSPKVMRDLKLFSIIDDNLEEDIIVGAIHNKEGYQAIRESLAGQYNLGNREPNIQVTKVNIRGDRSITLEHARHNRVPLGESTEEVLKHIHRIWGFDVHLHSTDNGILCESFQCPSPTDD